MGFEERFRKDWAFKKIFYQKIDEMLTCEHLNDLQPNIEFLVYFSDQIDGKTIYQPLNGFYLFELESFLYGLLNWEMVKQMLVEQEVTRQIDIISNLSLDKDKTEFFLYTLDKIGVLKKQKQGRYNVYSFVTERINGSKLKNGWALFDKTRRLCTDEA
jgi:hypothetical protein